MAKRVSDTAKPKLLDLFCGGGGASMGYYLAGFDVTGLDIKPQPKYPFKFYLADALTFLIDGFDAYHASPPCQKWSTATNIAGTKHLHKDLIQPIRERLKATGKPYIIENIRGAPLVNPFYLCGTMFGLKLKRHRYFECSFDIYFAPATCSCKGKRGYTAAHRGYSSFKRNANLICVAGHNFAANDGREAMGIDWVDKNTLREAIPPIYTQYIGAHLLKDLKQ